MPAGEGHSPQRQQQVQTSWGEEEAACISLDHQEGQCDLSMVSEDRMVEVGLEGGARL